MTCSVPNGLGQVSQIKLLLSSVIGASARNRKRLLNAVNESSTFEFSRDKLAARPIVTN